MYQIRTKACHNTKSTTDTSRQALQLALQKVLHIREHLRTRHPWKKEKEKKGSAAY
jgi:hypothetical protein